MSASKIDSAGVGGALRLSPPPYEFYSFGLVVLQTRAERKTMLAGPSESFQQDCDVGSLGASRFAPLYPMPRYVYA